SVALGRALDLAVLPAERQLVQQRLDACRSAGAAAARTGELASGGPGARPCQPPTDTNVL
ncbi:MAG: hypothetical protein ABIQ12_01480, partial [Opitutaceae bacterium]